jgi:hypothetical protein
MLLLPWFCYKHERRRRRRRVAPSITQLPSQHTPGNRSSRLLCSTQHLCCSRTIVVPGSIPARIQHSNWNRLLSAACSQHPVTSLLFLPSPRPSRRRRHVDLVMPCIPPSHLHPWHARVAIDHHVQLALLEPCSPSQAQAGDFSIVDIKPPSAQSSRRHGCLHVQPVRNAEGNLRRTVGRACATQAHRNFLRA